MSTGIPDAARTRILGDLARIEAEEGVRVLFAVESGSRAWGFPSPDSDYDARFVYVRPLDWYLQLLPGRDVIELPIEGLFDTNGWDIRKALGLLLKPNPVLLEWLASPIRYIWDEALCTRLRSFAERTAYAEACIHHYYGVARRLGREHLEGRETVNLKRYFYVVRPALCLLWVRERRPGAPPMSLSELMAGLTLPPGFADEIAGLLDRKVRASEVGEGSRIPVLDQLIEDQLAWAQTVPTRIQPSPELRAEADALFRQILADAWAGGGP
jgi:predicted nucleotidyltransferase